MDQKTKIIGGLDEENEITIKTKKVGESTSYEMQSTIRLIQEEQTTLNYEAATMRIGATKESTIVEEFWNYYTKFSSNNLPKPDSYMAEDEAELKITVLSRLFQQLYRERIYPSSFPVPILHYFFRKTKTKIPKPAKFLIVGDTHGSFIDTMKMIKYFVKTIEQGQKEGFDVKIIFIGDFIDRNSLDIHNLLYIMTFNLRYPENVIMLRGNHEEVSINANYGFGNNVLRYFNKILYANFNNVFMDLPLICILHCNDGNIACLHGGIPIIIDSTTNSFTVPLLNSHIFKNREIFIEDMDSVTQQLLWNDPMVVERQNPPEPYYPNRRGLGYIFGKPVFDEFCRINDIQLVFRGHQAYPEGLRKFFSDRFVTVFSASDYSNRKITARFIEMDSMNIFAYEDYIIQEDPRLF